MEIVARRTNLISHSSACLRDASPHSPSFRVSRGSTLRNTANLRGSKSASWLHSNGGKSRPSVSAKWPDGVAAAAATSTLQQTARGWLASYDNRLSQDFWSQQPAPGRRGSQESERLPPVASHTARRENFKKEHYSTELDRIASGQEGRARSKEDLVHGPCMSLEELEKQVKTGCDMHEIDKLVRSASDQHRNFKPHRFGDDVEEVPREPETIKPARRKRTSTEQPRNPRWRVEERIKRERELSSHTGYPPKGTHNLPMTQFAVQTDHGREEHALVDIHAIQNKCRGLFAGCSAKSLLEQQRVREEASSSKKSVDRSCQPELDALAALTWEDRMELAERRKLEGHISTVFNRMSQMRGKYPKDVPDSLVNHLQAMEHGDFNWHEPD